MFPKHPIHYILFLFLALLFLPGPATHAAGTVIYVNRNATGANDGSSWQNAYTGLQSALTAAASGTEIWVAAGVYKPTTGSDRTATFQLKNGVALYGGFAGGETSRDQRNWTANVTTLSGDISMAGIKTDNVYHVVTGSGTDSTAILDGFTVTGGNANGSALHERGGGMINSNGSPTLANVTFSDNSATNGGGMDNIYSNPTLMKVTFSRNSATYGGGMDNINSSPTLVNVTFDSNSAFSNGGGMINGGSNPTLDNVTFRNNSATDYGGGMTNSSGNPRLTNVTFSGNWANWGGGMVSYDSSPTLTNVTFSGNTALTEGGGMYNLNNSNPQIRNTILWGNTAPAGAQLYNYSDEEIPSTATLINSIVQDGCPAGSTCTNLITADPRLGRLGSYGGSTQTIPLRPGSPAIDAGIPALCPTTDQRGQGRVGVCDIGAFEAPAQTQTFLPVVIR